MSKRNAVPTAQKILRAVVLPTLGILSSETLVACAIPEANAQHSQPEPPGTRPVQPPGTTIAPPLPGSPPIMPMPVVPGEPPVTVDAGIRDAGRQTARDAGTTRTPVRPPGRVRPPPGPPARPRPGPPVRYVPGSAVDDRFEKNSEAQKEETQLVRTGARRKARTNNGPSDPGCAGAGAIRRRGPA